MLWVKVYFLQFTIYTPAGKLCHFVIAFGRRGDDDDDDDNFGCNLFVTIRDDFRCCLNFCNIGISMSFIDFAIFPMLLLLLLLVPGIMCCCCCFAPFPSLCKNCN